jgi:SNF2 family DNA or RNA helicase
VFHFDRWWNPAVENQATDRAFRIGQTKNVQVHKYLCAGTFEEKIDDLIERKKALAEAIVGTSEGWITELSTEQLKELFTLRKEAVGDE